MEDRYLILLPEYTLGGAEAQMRYIIYSLEEKHILADVCILNTLKKVKDSLLERDRRRLQFVEFFELHIYHQSEYQEREGIREYVRKNAGRRYRVVLFFNETYITLIPFFKANGISTVYLECLDGNRVCNDEICRPFVKECDILCANSFFAARKMELAFGRKIRVIPNGKEYKERLGYTRKKQIKNILVPCRIAPIKNLGIVVDMLLAHIDRDFIVHFVGGRDYVNYGKRLEDKVKNHGLEGRVVFTGYKEFMEEEYGWADLVVLPSFAEGAPNVVLEAYQYGRPVIVSDIESERELVPDDRLRFSTEDAEEMFKCIEYVEKLSDAEFEEMLEEHSRYVKEEYCLSKMTDAFIEILNEARETKIVFDQMAEYKACSAEFKKLVDEHGKKELFYSLLCRWNTRLQENDSIVRFFTKRNYQRVAIYGFRELGELLYRELHKSQIEVCYVLDRDADKIDSVEVPVIRPDAGFVWDIDVIVVTAVSYFTVVKNELKKMWDGDIVSLEDVIYEE